MRRSLTTWAALMPLFAVLLACFQQPGYQADAPGHVVCGCDDGDTCFEGATSLATQKGETVQTAEELMYFSQCACFQGSMAGCNILGHFAKDWTRACDAGKDDAVACTFAGFIYHHGVQIPRINGRSFDRDENAATTAFTKACKAGTQIACAHVSLSPAQVGSAAKP